MFTSSIKNKTKSAVLLAFKKKSPNVNNLVS